MSGRSSLGLCVRGAAIALLAAALGATAGCGQSGPLTLPSKNAKSTAAPTNKQAQDGDTKKDKSDASEDGQ